MDLLSDSKYTLKPATVTYPVSIDGNTSSISLTAGTTTFDQPIIRSFKQLKQSQDYEEETAAPQYYIGVYYIYNATKALYYQICLNISTYGGFFKALSDTYDSSLHYVRDDVDEGYRIENKGAVSNRHLNSSKHFQTLYCSMLFLDPTDNIVAAIRELMFRTAIASANDTQATDVHHFTVKANLQTIQGHIQPTIYTSFYFFLALAVLSSLLGWVATLPIFLGWWHLGRTVSLSPIKTAKAFGAPGLNTNDSNADAKHILKDVGRQEVRYGALRTTISEELGDEANERIRLVMSEPELVRIPNAGERFAGSKGPDRKTLRHHPGVACNTKDPRMACNS